MLVAISSHGLFHNAKKNNGLWNFLELQKATGEQSHDLLNFREISQVGYETFVLTKLLNAQLQQRPFGESG